VDGNTQARVRFLLARALTESGQRSPRVSELVTQARQAQTRTPFPHRGWQAELERWARANGLPPAGQADL
jgi:hypothetical protein